MSVASSPSDSATARDLTALDEIRVDGGVRMTFAARAGGTYLARLREADGYRVRVPAESSTVTDGCEAILLNTGGGVAGGDRVSVAATLQAGSNATITTVAAERVYRASSTPAHIDISLRLAEDSRLGWLPQETILYSRVHLVRRFQVDLAERAVATLLDIIVLGRRGAGERIAQGTLDDRWSIRRSGRLVHMEAMRLTGSIDEVMQRPAIGGGAHVIATLVHLAAGAEERLEVVRELLRPAQGLVAAVSAWDGKLVVRALGERSAPVRHALAATATLLTGRVMPRSWAT